MTTAFPLIALALALVAAALSRRLPGQTAFKAPTSAIASLVLLAILGIAAWQAAPESALVPALTGLTVGMLLAIACVLSGASWVAPVGFAAAAAGGMHWVAQTGMETAQLALVVGSALGALMAQAEDAESPQAGTLAVTAFVASDFLGRRHTPNESFAYAGTIAGIAITLVGLVSLWIGVGGAESVKRWRPVIIVALVAGFGWLIASRYLFLNNGWIIMAAASVSALAVHWLVGDDDPLDPLRTLIGVVIWLGLATISFGLARGFGMSLALMAAAGSLVLIGNRRGLLTLAPLLSLVMYRVFRESHTSASRALDIGQHYALIGLAVGAILPLLPLEWFRMEPKRGATLLGAGMWAVLMVAAAPLLSLTLAAKGIVGFIAGLGFSGLLEGVRAGKSILPVAITAGVGASAVLTFGWLGGLLGVTREEKIRIFLWTLLALVVLGLVIYAASPRKTLKESEA